MACECAGIHVGQRRDLVFGQVLDQRLPGAPVALTSARVAHDQSTDVWLSRFRILVVDPSIANVRVGHHHHLPSVGGIREDLLVAGHAGIEYDLADLLPNRAEGAASENRAIFED
jgi:hypothetical protein